MYKRLLKPVIMVSLPLFFAFAYLVYTPINPLAAWLNERLMNRTYLGSFRYIDNALMGLTQEEVLQRFPELVSHFGVEFKLLPLNEVTKSQKRQARLKQGELVYVQSDGDVSAYKLSQHNLVMTVAFEETEQQAMYRLGKGPVYLIKQRLAAAPLNPIADRLLALQKEFGFSFRLVNSELAAQEQSGHRVHPFPEFVWMESSDKINGDALYVPLENNQLLVVEDFSSDYVNYFVFAIIISTIALLVGLGVLAWLWPLWNDHANLNRTAREFGRGRLDTRVKIGKGSLASDLGKTFNQMADDIQNLISANQKITNAVAHDLRTPLARLRFAVEILATSDGHSAEEKERYQKTINRSIDSLDYLINQTLVHSRYSRAADLKLFKHTNFSEHILDEVSQYKFDNQSLAFETNIDYFLQENTQFMDAKSLGRALTNLLDNAVVHAKSIIRVSYFQEGDSVCLKVEDDGDGISEENFQKVLQPYAQLGNQQRESSDSLGLGLAIVNQISQWHNGQLSVTYSELGGAAIQLSWQPHQLSAGQ